MTKGKATSSPCIVVCGNYNYVSTTLGLANGFKSIGWEVHRVDLGSFSPKSRSFTDRIIGRLFQTAMIRKYNRAILECVLTLKPAAFLMIKGTNVSQETIDEIRRAGTLVINYYPDLHFSYKGVDEAEFASCDRFYTTKSFQVDYLDKLIGPGRVEFLHHGYLPGFHAPPEILESGGKLSADILYIGNHSEEKESWLLSIKQSFPDAVMKIYGNRWQNVKSRNILGASIGEGPLYGVDYAAAINSAKINLGIHMGRHEQSGWSDLVSTRTFEIPACKGFMLHIDNDDVRQLFTPGVEIDVFRNMDELKNKIDFYLSHDEIRREMLERAYERCVPAYSYDARARVIADWILLQQYCL